MKIFLSAEKAAMRKSWKKRAGILLSAVMVLSVTSGLPVKQADAETNFGRKNPRINSTGTEWDCVYFGKYQQNAAGEKKPVKWRVLSVNGDDAFLLSDNILDAMPYNEEDKAVTWETCTLRSWLNGYGSLYNTESKDFSSNNFIDTAFTAQEKEAIKQTTVKSANTVRVIVSEGHIGPYSDDNLPATYEEVDPEIYAIGGNDTSDKIYLLSAAEASKQVYGFNTNPGTETSTREARQTEYVGMKDYYDEEDLSNLQRNASWWLRSPGYGNKSAVECDAFGCLWYGDPDDEEEVGTVRYQKGIRPVLHLSLASKVWSYAGTVNSSGKETSASSSNQTPNNSSTSTANTASSTKKSSTSGKNPCKKVKAAKKKYTIKKKGNTIKVIFNITATISSKKTTDTLTAKIAKTKIAKVKKKSILKGKAVIIVKGLKKGKTTLTVKVGKKSAKTTIQVKK